MKLKMAIIFGVLIWILTNCIASIFHPIFNNNLPYFNILIPILTIITTVFFGIIYIRNVDENEVVEGVLAGVVFCLVNLILDLLIFIFFPFEIFHSQFSYAYCFNDCNYLIDYHISGISCSNENRFKIVCISL